MRQADLPLRNLHPDTNTLLFLLQGRAGHRGPQGVPVSILRLLSSVVDEAKEMLTRKCTGDREHWTRVL